MKRILFAFVLVLFSIPIFAAAEVDLSGMSYDELVKLSKEVGLAIMSNEDFDSVSVPMGLWEVGVDIPEGTWVLSSDAAYVVYGSDVESNGNSMNMFSSGNSYQELLKEKTWKVDATSGNYFYINFGNVTFSTSKGSADLGFKKK